MTTVVFQDETVPQYVPQGPKWEILEFGPFTGLVKMPAVWTKIDVLRCAANLVRELGVDRGSPGCLLTRLAQAHLLTTREPISWAYAGYLYFGKDVSNTIVCTNDSIADKGIRGRWASKVLEQQAEREETYANRSDPR